MELISGNVYIRPNGPYFAGDVIEGHRHNFDHTTICFYGAIKVVFSDQELILKAPHPDYNGPSHMLIKAGVEHEITFLIDGSIFWCVYSHRNSQGDVVDKYEGVDDAYGIHS